MSGGRDAGFLDAVSTFGAWDLILSDYEAPTILLAERLANRQQ